MAFLDKLGDFAKNVGEKTGDALETGKLQMKVRSEKSKIEDNYKKLGEYYYNKHAVEGLVDADASKYFDEIDELNKSIKKIEEEIAEIKKSEGSASNNENVVDSVATEVNNTSKCPSCGKENQAGSKFCSGCGTSL